MANYYLNTQVQSNGDHEVHKDGCSYMPSITNRIYLGNFDSCEPAVAKAKLYRLARTNGCYYCSKSCHTS